MAGMLQEEHPISLMYKIFLKMCLVYTSSWVHISTKFNGVFFFGLIMDLTLRRCWKNDKKGFKKGVQNSMFFGSKLWKVKNWAENDDFLPAKRFWLSFPENNSDWAEI